MLRPLITTLLFSTSGLALVGCLECTLVGCANALVVDLVELPSEPGLYTVSLEGDAEQSCTFEIGEDLELVEETRADACFRGAFAGEPLVSFGVGEGEYEVHLSDADGEIASTVVSAEGWSEHAPNGPRCGPVCSSRTVELEEAS